MRPPAPFRPKGTHNARSVRWILLPLALHLGCDLHVAATTTYAPTSGGPSLVPMSNCSTDLVRLLLVEEPDVR